MLRSLMGILRFLLAVCVLLWHCPEGVLPRYMHGALAVQCFYIISGFLIQMVITSKYEGHKRWRRRFYLSRILRIYPLYLLILVMTMLVGEANTRFISYTQNGNWAAAAAWTINNFLIVGQDVLRFFSFDGHTFAVMPASQAERHELLLHADQVSLSVVPQSWTLAIELYFYLLAPLLLVRSTRTLIAAVITLSSLRILLGYSFDLRPELLYGFFPTELPLFLCGSLAYRAYTCLFESGRLLQILGRVNGGDKALSLLCAAVVGCSCLIILRCNLNFVSAYAPSWLRSFATQWGSVPLYAPTGYWLILLMTAGVLPFAFHFSRRFPYDRYIGELSYPIYISHILIRELLKHKLQVGPSGQAYIGVGVLGISIALSMLLVEFIEKPVDRFRHGLSGG